MLNRDIAYILTLPYIYISKDFQFNREASVAERKIKINFSLIITNRNYLFITKFFKHEGNEHRLLIQVKVIKFQKY